MGVVEDKGKSLGHADTISMHAMVLISNAIREHLCSDDPAENSYLAVHIMGNLYARMCISLEGYNTIYGIEGMTADAVKSWIQAIASEHLDSRNGKGET